jgi:hypothetical protein
MHTELWSENLKERSLGKPRHGLEDNIRMNLREMVWEGVDWMHLV